jgi:hypothetical protein
MHPQVRPEQHGTAPLAPEEHEKTWLRGPGEPDEGRPSAADQCFYLSVRDGHGLGLKPEPSCRRLQPLPKRLRTVLNAFLRAYGDLDASQPPAPLRLRPAVTLAR